MPQLVLQYWPQEDELIPFFTEAGIDFEVLLTRYAGHAQEVVANERLSDWRGLVSRAEPFSGSSPKYFNRCFLLLL
jgi:hypothetical protein